MTNRAQPESKASNSFAVGTLSNTKLHSSIWFHGTHCMLAIVVLEAAVQTQVYYYHITIILWRFQSFWWYRAPFYVWTFSCFWRKLFSRQTLMKMLMKGNEGTFCCNLNNRKQKSLLSWTYSIWVQDQKLKLWKFWNNFGTDNNSDTKTSSWL